MADTTHTERSKLKRLQKHFKMSPYWSLKVVWTVVVKQKSKSLGVASYLKWAQRNFLPSATEYETQRQTHTILHTDGQTSE